MAMGTRRSRVERRRREKMIFLDRRKGKIWIVVQVTLLAILLYILFQLLS